MNILKADCFSFQTAFKTKILFALLALLAAVPAQVYADACTFKDDRFLQFDLMRYIRDGSVQYVSAGDTQGYINLAGRACPTSNNLSNQLTCPAGTGKKAFYSRGRFDQVTNTGQFQEFTTKYRILKPLLFNSQARRSWAGGVNETNNGKAVVVGYSDDSNGGNAADIKVHATVWTGVFAGSQTPTRVSGITQSFHSFAFGVNNFNAGGEYIAVGTQIDGSLPAATEQNVYDLTNPENALKNYSEGFYYRSNTSTIGGSLYNMNATLSATRSDVRGVNNDQFIVGTFQKANGDIRAFIYDANASYPPASPAVRAKLPTRVVELPPLPGDSKSYATSINNYFISSSPYLNGTNPLTGVIYGFSARTVDGVQRVRAVAWNPDFDYNNPNPALRNQIVFTTVDLFEDWPTTGNPTTSDEDSGILASNSYGMAVGFRTKRRSPTDATMIRYAAIYRDGSARILDMNTTSPLQFASSPDDPSAFLEYATSVSDAGIIAAGGITNSGGVATQYSFLQSPSQFRAVKLESRPGKYVGKIRKTSSDGSKIAGCSVNSPYSTTCVEPLLMKDIPTIANPTSIAVAGNGGASSGEAIAISADGTQAAGNIPMASKWSIGSTLPTAPTTISSLSSITDVDNAGLAIGSVVSGTYNFGVGCLNTSCSSYYVLMNPKLTMAPLYSNASRPLARNNSGVIGGYYLDPAVTAGNHYRAAAWKLPATAAITLSSPSGADGTKPSQVIGIAEYTGAYQFMAGYATTPAGKQVGATWIGALNPSNNLVMSASFLVDPPNTLSSKLNSINSVGQAVGYSERQFKLKTLAYGSGFDDYSQIAMLYDYHRISQAGYQPGDEYQNVRNLASPNDGIMMLTEAFAVTDSTEIFAYGYGLDGNDGYWKLIPPLPTGSLNFACDVDPPYPPQPPPPADWPPPPPPPDDDPAEALGVVDLLGLVLLGGMYRRRKNQ